MSLINQVLQDLDQRHRVSGLRGPLPVTGIAHTQQESDGAVGRDNTKRMSRRRFLLWSLVATATLTAVLLGLGLNALGGPDRSPEQQIVVALPPGQVVLDSAAEAGAQQPASERRESVGDRPLTAPPSSQSVSSMVPIVWALVLEQIMGADILRAHQALKPASEIPRQVPRQSVSNAAAAAVPPPMTSSGLSSPEPDTPTTDMTRLATATAESAGALQASPGPAESEVTEPHFIALRNAVEPSDESEPVTATPAEEIRSAFTVAKPNGALPLAQADQAIERGELAVAEQLLRRRVDEKPGDRRARELLIGLMLRGERYPAAIEQLDEGLARAPGHAKFVLIKARLLAQSGELAGALRLLESLPQVHDGRVEAVQMLGALYQQQGRYADAVASYRELLGLKPNYGPAWVGYAISLDGTGDRKALAAYRRALRLDGVPAAAAKYAHRRIAQLEAEGD